MRLGKCHHVPEIMRRASNRKGFSTIELFIAVLLGLVVITGVGMTLKVISKQWQRAQIRLDRESAVSEFRRKFHCAYTIAGASACNALNSITVNLKGQSNETIVDSVSGTTIGKEEFRAKCIKQGNQFVFTVESKTMENQDWVTANAVPWICTN